MSSVTKRDYYEVLGIERQATDQEIKSAYRKLALKFHPDRNPGDHKAEEAFKEAAEAYAVLADREKRGLYDRFGHAGVAGAGAGAGGFDPTIFADFSDIFSGLGDVFGLRRYLRPASPARRSAARLRSSLRPRDLVRGIRDRHRNLDPDSARGNLRDVQGLWRRRAGHRAETCSQCRGLGTAAVPAGLPHRRSPVPQLPRHRQDDCETLSDLPRRRPRRPRAKTDGEDSGRDRNRSALASLRRRGTRIGRRTSRRSLRRRPRAGALVLPSRGRRPVL